MQGTAQDTEPRLLFVETYFRASKVKFRTASQRLSSVRARVGLAGTLLDGRALSQAWRLGGRL